MVADRIRIPDRTPEEVEKFAKSVGISIKDAQRVNKKREWHILWEYDYIRKKSIVQ